MIMEKKKRWAHMIIIAYNISRRPTITSARLIISLHLLTIELATAFATL